MDNKLKVAKSSIEPHAVPLIVRRQKSFVKAGVIGPLTRETVTSCEQRSFGGKIHLRD